MKDNNGNGFRIVSLLLVTLFLASVGCGNQVGQTNADPIAPTSSQTLIAQSTISNPVGASNSTSASTESPLPPDILPEVERTLNDTDASLKTKEKRVLTGDDFFKGLFERPFTSQEMVYQEDVDIRVANFSKNDVFYFFTIELHGLDSETKQLTGTYGIEFDRTKTGHGDFLVWVKDAKKEWSMQEVKAFSDEDKSVGGPSPVWADQEYKGEGYEKEEKLEGERVAYARIDPQDATIVQIAVSKALLDFPKEFLWGVWADKGWQDPMRFDYNDHILERLAGSPVKTSKYYPIKELSMVDNTCRLTEGFTTTDVIRGKCMQNEFKMHENFTSPPVGSIG